jgi:hypothetical protein
MGGDLYSQYNNEKDASINFESNKVCVFPGEIIAGTITLFPFIQSFEKITTNPKLNITITELKRYSYSTGSGKHKRTVVKKEEKNLVSTSIDFGALVTMDYSAGIKIPFSVQIPNDAYPSINFGYGGYVKHLFIVELPDLKAKRTKYFIIKNNFPNNFDNTLLRNMIEENKEYKKSKLFFDKGSCLLNFKMPKNYFFYNERIPFEVNLDCSKLKMEVYSIKLSLLRKTRKNNYQDYSQIQRYFEEELNQKKFNLDKGLNKYYISDFLEFPTSSDYNSVYPPKVYTSFDEHGFLEVNDSKFTYKLYPSAYNGLVSVDYLIDLKIYFDSSLTFDENFIVPIYFSANFENNYNNNNYNSNYNYNNNMNSMFNQGVGSSIPYISSNNIYCNNNINANFTPQ